MNGFKISHNKKKIKCSWNLAAITAMVTSTGENFLWSAGGKYDIVKSVLERMRDEQVEISLVKMHFLWTKKEVEWWVCRNIESKDEWL